MLCLGTLCNIHILKTLLKSFLLRLVTNKEYLCGLRLWRQKFINWILHLIAYFYPLRRLWYIIYWYLLITKFRIETIFVNKSKVNTLYGSLIHWLTPWNLWSVILIIWMGDLKPLNQRMRWLCFPSFEYSWLHKS